MDNIPKEIRDKFNPIFAKELNTIVRQKSHRRELLGFEDPIKPITSDEDILEQFESFQNSVPRSKR